MVPVSAKRYQASRWCHYTLPLKGEGWGNGTKDGGGRNEEVREASGTRKRER